jgi:hypothetical protein
LGWAGSKKHWDETALFERFPIVSPARSTKEAWSCERRALSGEFLAGESLEETLACETGSGKSPDSPDPFHRARFR